MKNIIAAIAISCLLGTTLGQQTNGSAITTCYYCDSSDTPSCVDPYDTTNLNLEEAACADLTPSDGNSRSNLHDVQRSFGFERKTEGPVRYKCVKLFLVKSGQTSVLRTCGIDNPTTRTVCEYLKAENDDLVDCYECDGKNKCNGASINTISLGLAALALALFKLR